MTDALRLYLVADPDHVDGNLIATVGAALRGGATAIQLRAKRMSDREQLAMAAHLATMCRERGVPLLINDRIDIALAAGADGVHLGVDDLPVTAARAIAGPGFLIGFSPDSDDQIAGAASAGADYLGIGPVFATRTKDDAGAALGLDGFRRRCEISPVPVVGIGGIAVHNAASVIDAGATGVAVVSAIMRSEGPEQAARDLSLQVETSVR